MEQINSNTDPELSRDEALDEFDEEDSEELEDRDSILDIMLAMMVVDRSEEQRYLKLDEVKEIVDRLSKLGDEIPDLHEYDMPDLSIDSILANEHVDYVSLDNEISFRMDPDKAIDIINRNSDIIRTILTIDLAMVIGKQAKKFDDDCKKLSNGRVSLVVGDPNLEYLLSTFDNGEEKNEDKLLTDGQVTILEESYCLKRVKLDGASYAIHASFARGRLDEAEVICGLMNQTFLNYLICDVRDLCKDQYGGYEHDAKKPYVYTIRKNQ